MRNKLLKEMLRASNGEKFRRTPAFSPSIEMTAFRAFRES